YFYCVFPFLFLVLIIDLITALGQMVQMDSDRSGYVGSQVELRCEFINSNPPVKISQVTWQKFSNGTKQNVAIANPALGVSVLQPFKERVRFKNPAVRQRTPSLEDTTIIFNNLRLSDEAAYICEYTTFPAGNRESMVNLTVYGRLIYSIIKVNTPLTFLKSLAWICWDLALSRVICSAEKIILTQYYNPFYSEKYCICSNLNCFVFCLFPTDEPEVIIDGFDGNWYINRDNVQLTCLADANPAISLFQWRYLNGSMPDAVELRDDTLIFKGPITYGIAGTYVCDATNSIGTGSASVEVTTPSSEQQRAGAAIGGAVVCGTVLLAAVTLLAVFFHRQRRTFKGDYSTKKQVLGNGLGKAGGLAPCPSLPHSLSYPDDSSDEKKPELYGAEHIQEFHDYPDSRVKSYSTVEDSTRYRYDEPSYLYDCGSEVEISVDMVPQMDGSVISKEEWYV
uniref:Nectin cell adhesion molecule 1a n=1 Tax=Astyanax mexicanus TaxID=7994 RepID=A0A8B9KAW5_ASTMX